MKQRISKADPKEETEDSSDFDYEDEMPDDDEFETEFGGEMETDIDLITR